MHSSSPTLPPDSDLLHQFTTNRSPTAFRQLVDRHLPMVFSAASRILRDRHLAEDVAQSVFLFLSQHPQKPGTRPLAGWLYQTTLYACSNLQRIEKRRRQRETAAMSQSLPQSPSPRLSDEEIHLDRALHQLPTRLRDVILLRYVDDHSLAEIATLTHIPIETAKKRLHRALAKLRASFTSQGLTTPEAPPAPPTPLRHLAKSNSVVAPTLASAITTTALSQSPPASTLLLTKSIAKTLTLHSLAKASATLLSLLLLTLLGTTLATHKNPTTPIATTTPPATLPQSPSTKPFIPTPNEPPPPAIAELEKQIFAARDAITSGHFIAESFYENLSNGRTFRALAEDYFDQAHSVDHRYFTGGTYNGGVDIRCFTPDFAYDYIGAGIPTAQFQIFPRGQERAGLRPYDPRALMFNPSDYSNACLAKRDTYIGSVDRHAFHVDETQWQNQKALRVSFVRTSIRGEVKCIYLAVPSRSFNIVEVIAGPGGTVGDSQWTVKCTLKEIAPGIWFPDHVNYAARKGEATESREDVTIQASSINQPVDPALFTLKGMNIPVGINMVQIGTPMGKWDGQDNVPATQEDYERWQQMSQAQQLWQQENPNATNPSAPASKQRLPSPPPPHLPPTSIIPAPK